MMTDFNPEQKKAIESTPGVFIVKAGAGTGKTTVLINKYLAIYSRMIEKGIDAHQACSSILTVTFTKRAAKEMLNRLKDEIDPGILRYAHISTIDAFCSRFLKENSYTAGMDSDIEVIDEVEAKLLFMKLGCRVLEKDVDFSVVTEMSREKFLNESFDLINKLKQQLISSDVFLSAVRDNADIHRAVYCLYKEYEGYLERENLMDFGSLLTRTYNIIKNNSNVKEEVARKFIHVLVDEYQDTNPAQVKLLRLIAQPQNNFFAVGDEQQSIYGFRGAAPEFIMEHYDQLPESDKTTLKENYRSFYPIPDMVNTVFAEKMKGYHEIKCENKEEKGDIEIFLADNRRQEAVFVSSKVKFFLDSGSHPDDIAILLRSVKTCRMYEDALRNAGVKTVTVGGTGFYGQPEIKDLVSLLSCADNPYNEKDIVRVMRLEVFAFTDSEIAALASKKNKDTTIYEAVLSASDEKTVMFRNFIEKARKLKNELTLVELIQFLLHESGIAYRTVSMPGGKQSRQMSNIEKFTRQARNFQTRNIFSTLADFTEYLRQLEEAEIAEAEARPRVEGVVHLMSIHQSKGLQFPVVIIPNIARSNFPGRMRPADFHFRQDAGLIIKDKSKGSDYEEKVKRHLFASHNMEEQRLLYVAMTRAVKNLVISGHMNSKGKISKFMEYFLDEKEETSYALKKNLKKYAVRIKEFSPAGSGEMPSKKSLSQKNTEEFLRSSKALGIPGFYRTKQIASEFSVTQLQTYGACPRQYFYSYRLNIKPPSSEKIFSPSLFGSAIHRMLEEHYSLGGLDSIQKMIEKTTSLIISSGIESSVYNKYYADTARETVEKIVKSKMLRLPEEVIFTEKPFVLKIDDAYINGTIDRLDGPAEKPVLIDYKTSFSQDTDKYSIQTGIYSIALEEVFGMKPARTEIYFLKSGDIKSVPHMTHSRMKIKSLISGIRSGKFHAVRGEHCKNCNFCKNR